ncbi:CbiX/SirB N-terminal domain-containing protein, partial [Streptomyces sp. NRRL B-24085]|uniref:CbiX/SirB N-terminal domain-containing protein n=2 Tax=Streptomyces sp. NRRL B-24085 TaxID=1709476 RepID=UPI000A948E02
SAALPRTQDAVRELRSLGCAKVAVAPYVLAPGFLPDRIARGAADADVLAEVLGPAPEVARVLLERYDAAVSTAPADHQSPVSAVWDGAEAKRSTSLRLHP